MRPQFQIELVIVDYAPRTPTKVVARLPETFTSYAPAWRAAKWLAESDPSVSGFRVLKNGEVIKRFNNGIIN